MIKAFFHFFIFFIFVFITDQSLKKLFIDGFRWDGEYISLILVYNKGVAFSMLSFLEGHLKHIQLLLFLAISVYLLFHKDIFKKYAIPIGMIYGAGLSNVYDRFIYGGVVDYIYWHKWFDFAVFNFADVIIDISVGLILLITYLGKKEEV